jgi:hypothetical protein
MVAESDGKIDMKIVLRDENEELMNLFLTKAKSIPKLIVINKETGGAHWGQGQKDADLIDNYKRTWCPLMKRQN